MISSEEYEEINGKTRFYILLTIFLTTKIQSLKFSERHGKSVQLILSEKN